MACSILFRHLTLVVPPRISPFYFENAVTEGMRTQLMCTTSQGDQPFNITWLRDESPIQARRDVTTEQPYPATGTSYIQISDYSPFSSILTINSVTAKHSGNYTCQISNVAGVAEHTADLSVSGWSPYFLIPLASPSSPSPNHYIIKTDSKSIRSLRFCKYRLIIFTDQSRTEAQNPLKAI